MGVELTMTIYAAALLLALVLVQAIAGVRSVGLMPLANSRDGLPAPVGFHARMLRVVDNHREGLTIFAPIAIVASIAGTTNDMSALGAQLFFYARAAHAVLYIFGVPMIRPLFWGIGIAGTAMVLLAALGLI
ncbi:MAG: MAPEG family protein [Hyphomonadaceae bacterium]|nr:MAPEG family protein [Hyphomonadaceae bacterium]